MRGDERALGWALAITAVFLALEVAGGLLSGSVALLADAGHMATDLAALGLALFAVRFARRAPTPSKTFGYRRSEILAALANGVLLVVVSIGVAWDALQRLVAPPDVESGLMLAVAVAGLGANLCVAWILHRGREHAHDNLNLRGAFLHVLGDLLGSLGAIVAALAIRFGGWKLADPVVALGITVLILVSAWRLLRESVEVLMESVPGHVDMDALADALRAVPGVLDVHDLHVWTLTSGYHAITAHVSVRHDAEAGTTLRSLAHLVRERFALEHSTFQLEPREPLLEIAPCPECDLPEAADLEGRPQGSPGRRAERSGSRG